MRQIWTVDPVARCNMYAMSFKSKSILHPVSPCVIAAVCNLNAYVLKKERKKVCPIRLHFLRLMQFNVCRGGSFAISGKLWSRSSLHVDITAYSRYRRGQLLFSLSPAASQPWLNLSRTNKRSRAPASRLPPSSFFGPLSPPGGDISLLMLCHQHRLMDLTAVC